MESVDMQSSNQSENGYRNIKETYKIEATIGRGTFATVKRAKHRSTGERFAVKVLAKRRMSDEDKANMLTEIEILKSCDHPNIVRLIEVFEDERHWCLVMELMKGGELFDKILECEQFSEKEARDAVRSLVDAISYCHQKGIIHRDIKPENLLLQDKEMGIASLKMADFGLSRMLEEGKMASTACGTPGYVAPEILESKPYGMPCDYWSIGVVAFILLSGTAPFYEEDNFALFEQIKQCKYDFEVETWQSVSDQAKDFVSQVLVKDPEQRMNCDQMMAHPWMQMKLKSDVYLSNSKQLYSYVSCRKQKSQKFKKELENVDEAEEF